MALARERRAREHDDSGEPAEAAVLRDPVLVVGLPSDWRTTTAQLEGTRAPARIWVFHCSAGGVRYWRSMALSIKGAMDHLYSHLC